MFTLEDITIEPSVVKLDNTVDIKLTVINNSPCDISCDSISLSLKKALSSDLQYVKRPVKREASDASLKEQVPNINIVKKGISPLINIQANFEGSKESPVSSGIVCVNSHELLRRSDSSGKAIKRASDVVLDDYTNSVSVSDVTLHPGANTIYLSKQVGKLYKQ